MVNGNMSLVGLLAAYEEAKRDRERAEVREREARDVLVAHAFPSPKEGTNNAPLPDGSVLKGKFVNYYKVKAGDQLDAALKLLPPAIRSALVKWKPEVSVSTYKALDATQQRVFNEVLTISPGSPQLEIVPPKGG